jgi:hypothetical protein
MARVKPRPDGAAPAPGTAGAETKPKRARRARVKYLYVIALDKAVLQSAAFRAENPGYVAGRPCVYVGSSSHRPGRRFDQHKRGYKAGRYVRRHGLYLRPSLFEHLNPVPAKDAERLERELAERLRRRGFGVHQA